MSYQTRERLNGTPRAMYSHRRSCPVGFLADARGRV
ncbi:hypothetical protein Rrhod_0514 [Rhodococcus rhodnii LMG 5362]|uniref:Uncharacterized protein n=1 Tax=Rhodococcus rhodnii LMG 5362 TaxID=1273125 RepID=R7WVJ2_9NOCA|nr:hypothetical protein Rrhod_0514 [Rhodococcus rhodnii LMG 5362]